jgi:hypothetical protein
MNAPLIINGGTTLNQGDARSAIFYDINNTGYYVDPASTSVVSAIDTGTAGTYNTFRTWTNLTGYHGFYSSVYNSAHFYPNNNSYGSWKIEGSRNGWGGIEVQYGSNGNITWMVNGSSNETGTHNNSYGWQYRFTSGGFYVSRNTYGGNESRVLQEDIWIGNKYFGSGGAIYGTIFYDANDSSYYIDPTGGTSAYLGGSISIPSTITLRNGGGPTYITESYGINLFGANVQPVQVRSCSLTVGVAASGGGYGTGNIYATGDITAYYSDERLKDIKGKIENPIEKLLSLDGFYYEANDVAVSLGYEKKLEVGLSAQQVEKILPEIIKEAPADNQYKTFNYAKLAPLFVEGFKAQQQIIEDQQKQIDELKELVNKLLNK